MKGFVIQETFGPTDSKQVVCKKEILTSANWQTLSEAIEGSDGERTAPGIFIGNRRKLDALPEESPSKGALQWGTKTRPDTECVPAQLHGGSVLVLWAGLTGGVCCTGR